MIRRKIIWCESTDGGKNILQNPTFIHDKSSQQTRELYLIKNIYKKKNPTGNIRVEKLDTFPLRQWRPLSPLLFNTVLEVPANALRQGKEEIKLSLFADDMTVYVENPKETTEKFLEITSL